jgi:hypothetical protein
LQLGEPIDIGGESLEFDRERRERIQEDVRTSS